MLAQQQQQKRQRINTKSEAKRKKQTVCTDSKGSFLHKGHIIYIYCIYIYIVPDFIVGQHFNFEQYLNVYVLSGELKRSIGKM